MHGWSIVALHGSATALEGLTTASERLRRSAADRRDALVCRGRGRVVGVLRHGIRQLLVEFEVDLLAIKQFLNDLIGRLLTAGLEQAIRFEDFAASILVIWVCQYHAQGGGAGRRSALGGSWLILAWPLRDMLSEVTRRGVELAAELVLSMRIATLVFVAALLVAYPVLAKLSFEVRVIHPVRKEIHQLSWERLQAKVRIHELTYIIFAA